MPPLPIASLALTLAAGAAAQTAAEANPYGLGCPTPLDFYELFDSARPKDLDGLAITLTPNGGGYDVSAAGMFDPNFAANLNAGDDQLFVALPLGFAIDVPGAGTVQAIDVDSNGRCGFGLARPDFSESVAEFLAGSGVILAANWDDLNPAAGGALHYDRFADRALITWREVPQFFNTGSNTFQVQVHAGGEIVMAWLGIEGDGLVGFSTGAGNADRGPIDVSADLPLRRSGGRPLTLTPRNTPVIGRNFETRTDNVPAGAVISGLLVAANRAAQTSPFFLPGCTVYADLLLDAFPIDPGTGLTGFPIPNDVGLVGARVYAQSVTIDLAIPSPAAAYLSNGLELVVGDV